jgi:thiol-disulfide isomerase/thioredoxin
MDYGSKYKNTSVAEITKTQFDLTGGKIKKKSKGKETKPCFIVVYAPWCPHCTGIVDDMDKLAKGFKNYGIDVNAINSDNPDNKELVEDLGVNGFPSFFWSDKNGDMTQITDMESRDVHGFVKMVCIKSGQEENCCIVDSNSKEVKCSKKK